MKTFNETTRRFVCALGIAALAAACGGGGGDGGSDDGGDGGDGGNGGPSIERTAAVLTTDFSSSSLASMPVADPTSATIDTQTFHSDSVARGFGSILYVINRFGADNIQALDAANDYATLWQCSVSDDSAPGVSQNPQDIVVDGNWGYVSRLAGGIAVVNLNPSADCSDFIDSEIDLSSLADADGIPEATKMVIVDGQLYVSLQRLDNFAPTDSSVIAVIDLETNSITDSITLSAPNPFAETKGLMLDPDSGKILVSSVGNFGAMDGGIERIDPATGTAEGHFVTEEDLGGDINDFVIVSGSRGYAVVSDADFNNSVVRFNPSNGQMQATLTSGPAFIPDIEYDASTDQLFVASQDFSNPGIRIFAADDSEVTSSPIDTGLPPFNINFLE